MNRQNKHTMQQRAVIQIPAALAAIIPMALITIWMYVLRDSAPDQSEFFLGPLLVGGGFIFWLLYLHIVVCRDSLHTTQQIYFVGPAEGHCSNGGGVGLTFGGRCAGNNSLHASYLGRYNAHVGRGDPRGQRYRWTGKRVHFSFNDIQRYNEPECFTQNKGGLLDD